MTARAVLPLGDCRLLTRRNAMRYCGQLGDERFDREVAPACPPRYIGQERFFDRADLDRWVDSLPVDRLGTARQPAGAGIDWRQRMHDDLHKDRRPQDRSR